MIKLKEALSKLIDIKNKINKIYDDGNIYLDKRSINMNSKITNLSNEKSYIEFINAFNVEEILVNVDVCISNMQKIYDEGINELKLIIEVTSTNSDESVLADENKDEKGGGVKRRTNKSKKTKKSKKSQTIKKRKNKSLRKKRTKK
jgi:hypothetical protein